MYNDYIIQFLTNWQHDQYAMAGSVNLHDLCWLGRVTTEDQPLKPLFPSALECLITKWNANGTLIKPSTLAYCNFVTTITFINTLMLWHNVEQYDFPAKIHSLLEYAHYELLRMQHEYSDAAKLYDKYFKFTGLVGRWIIPAYECDLLIRHGSYYLSELQKKSIQSYANLLGKLFPDGFDFAKLLTSNPLVYHFAECFPDKVLQLPLVQMHVNTTTTLPGYTVAFAARYYQLTRHKKVKNEVEKVLVRLQDGLLPNRRLTEVIFILYYLVKAQIDIKDYCKDQIDYLIENLHPNGVGVEPGMAVVYPDCDTSAVAQYVCHSLKLPLKMPTKRLNQWWSAEYSSYQSSDGRYSYNVSTVLHVLDAYLIATDVSAEEKYDMWHRTLTLLEQKSWEELHHLSPHYIWEPIISIIFTHAVKFPMRPTQVHYDALRLLLQFQAESGGFYSHYLGVPTLEETALALLALKRVLTTVQAKALWRQVTAAATKAEAFLLKNINNKDYPEFWVGKLLGIPIYIIEAILVSSLHK